MTQPKQNKPVQKKVRGRLNSPPKRTSYLSEHYSEKELALYRYFQGFGQTL